MMNYDHHNQYTTGKDFPRRSSWLATAAAILMVAAIGAMLAWRG